MADRNAVAEPDETVKGIINPVVNSVEDGSGNVLKSHKLREAPPIVKKSYLEVDGKYYFMERPDHLAFEDRGNRIRTDLNNAKIAGSMLDIAQAKGWTDIKVKGKETFRREAWLQATARGMEVKGYRPRSEDLARLRKMTLEMPQNGNDVIREEMEANDKARALNETRNLTELVREHPDLLREAAVITVGEKFSNRFTREEDRQRFVDRVRERVAIDYNMKREASPIYIKEERTIHRQQEVEIETDR
ncbi:MAG: hypothetical protein PHG20_00340 [Geobacteraceae bacterium]|nr:hypothetical protein [Geobacteraceae bacterium]